MTRGSDIIGAVQFISCIALFIGWVFFNIFCISEWVEPNGGRDSPYTPKRHLARAMILLEVFIAISFAIYGLVYHVDWSR